MPFFRWAALAAAAVALVGAPLIARDYRRGSLIAGISWARATSLRADTGAGFAMFRNSGHRPHRVIFATTPPAAQIRLDSMEKANGIMRMRLLPNGNYTADHTAAAHPSGSRAHFVSKLNTKEPDDTAVEKLRRLVTS